MSNTINDNSRIVLANLALSNNPDKPVIDDESGVDGKLNQTSDGRGYCMAYFSDPHNPFAVMRSRVIQQQMDANGNATWRSASPAQLKAWVGKEIPGEFITRTVEPYDVGGNTATTYTAVVLKGESISSIFKAAGHTIVQDTTEDVKVYDVTELAESAEDTVF